MTKDRCLLTMTWTLTTGRCSRSFFALISSAYRSHIPSVPGCSEQLVWRHSGVCIYHGNSSHLQNRVNAAMVGIRNVASHSNSSTRFPRWGLIIACLLATISILFFGSLFAMTGLAFIIQPFVQMIGGFLLPGKPMANMYFVLYSYSKSPISIYEWPPTLNSWENRFCTPGPATSPGFENRAV